MLPSFPSFVWFGEGGSSVGGEGNGGRSVGGKETFKSDEIICLRDSGRFSNTNSESLSKIEATSILCFVDPKISFMFVSVVGMGMRLGPNETQRFGWVIKFESDCAMTFLKIQVREWVSRE